jgi:hypothetical protein
MNVYRKERIVLILLLERGQRLLRTQDAGSIKKEGLSKLRKELKLISFRRQEIG